MITIEQFTALAHRTASRYSHRSEPARAFYTFSPEALADFHRQVCAASAQAQRVPDVDALADKIAECLRGTYHCNRVWEAWHVGTMSQDDFEPVDESETPREIAEEIAALLASTPAPAQQEPMEAFLVIDLSRELCVKPSILIRALQAQGIGNYSVNMALPKSAADAMRKHFKSAAQHQEQPQQERKPMTDVEIEGMYWEANRWLCTDLEDYKTAVRDTERHHGIKE